MPEPPESTRFICSEEYTMTIIPDPSQLPFPVTFFSLIHDGRIFRFVLPADPDAVFDTITDEQYDKDRFLPYWAEQWPSAAALFSFVMQHRLPVNQRIVELGCGLGVTASALAARHHYMIATDISLHGCRFAAYNIAANNGSARVVCADWRHPPFRRRFDLIVASDVLYEDRWIDPVLDCIGQLCAPEGSAWIADPCRRFWNRFKQRTVERGFHHRLLRRSPDNEGKTTIEIIEITRQPRSDADDRRIVID
ncbi:MAG: class I SAM-dependent methyltransferase [Chitinispirillaceae bacterium]|nr:class I SAM-dependent methyltransferase [Chitinispirillaceae bacterium]